MLYVVGDSNAVYTSPFLLSPSIDSGSMCRAGWKTEDVLQAVNRKESVADATAFFVFAGLNDDLTGEGIASNILQIVAALRARRSSERVPIFLAPPFCVADATASKVCMHRRKAGQILLRELGEDALGVRLVTVHVRRDLCVKKAAQTTKLGSSQIDPLHLNRIGYMTVANAVNHQLVLHSPDVRRPHKPKKIYEAEPAPPPWVAWAQARARRS